MSPMTDADIIKALGGCAKLARTFRKTRQAISKWGRDGIPNNRRLRLAKLATSRGIALPATFLFPKPDRRAP